MTGKRLIFRLSYIFSKSWMMHTHTHTHTHTKTYDDNFFPIHQLQNKFCIITQRNKNVLYKYFPKNWTPWRSPPYIWVNMVYTHSDALKLLLILHTINISISTSSVPNILTKASNCDTEQTLKRVSSPTKVERSSSKGSWRALLATINSFNLALSASFSSREFWCDFVRELYASYSSFMASLRIDSIEFGAIGILKLEIMMHMHMPINLWKSQILISLPSYQL